MIKISIPQTKMEDIKQQHVNKILPILREKYECMNPFEPFVSLLQNDNNLFDEDLIRLILIGKFDRMLDNPKLNYLFNLSNLINKAPIKIMKYLKKHNLEGTMDNRKMVRQTHFQRYFNQNYIFNFNIYDYITHNPDYYETSDKFLTFITELKSRINGFYTFLKDYFSYDYIIDNLYRHQLIYDMGITVCPYCNRQYITNYKYDECKRTTADLDHFYPVSKYPFLSLSIYNFIPSCPICNSRMKLSYSSEEIIYPYEEEFEEHAWFCTDLDYNNLDIGGLLGHSVNFTIDITIRNDSLLRDKIASSIKLFKLKEVYETHKDYVSEIAIKKTSNPLSHIEELRQLFHFVNISNKEIELLLYGNYVEAEDLCKRPLAKLTRDIMYR